MKIKFGDKTATLSNRLEAKAHLVLDIDQLPVKLADVLDNEDGITVLAVNFFGHGTCINMSYTCSRDELVEIVCESISEVYACNVTIANEGITNTL